MQGFIQILENVSCHKNDEFSILFYETSENLKIAESIREKPFGIKEIPK